MKVKQLPPLAQSEYQFCMLNASDPPLSTSEGNIIKPNNLFRLRTALGRDELLFQIHRELFDNCHIYIYIFCTSLFGCDYSIIQTIREEQLLCLECYVLFRNADHSENGIY